MAATIFEPIQGITIATIQALETSFEHVNISRYLAIAGFAVLLHDHLLTIEAELRTVWGKPKNLISWIFLVNRYLVPVIMAIDIYEKSGLASYLSLEFCQIWTLIEVHLHFLSHSAVHAIVALRVSAIWGQTRVVKYGVLVAWLVYFITNAAVSSYSAVTSYKTFHFFPLYNVCFGTIQPYVYWVWVPPLVLEGLLFLLTLLKAREQSQRSIRSMPVLFVLYRDGIIYFIVIALCSVFNLVVWRSAPPTLFALAKYFTFSIVNVMGSRMVLNLREIGDQDDDDECQEVLVFVESSITFDRAFPSALDSKQLQTAHDLRRLKSTRSNNMSRTASVKSVALQLKHFPSRPPGSLQSPSGAQTRFDIPHNPPPTSSIAYTIDMASSWEANRNDRDSDGSLRSTNFQENGLPWDGVIRNTRRNNS